MWEIVSKIQHLKDPLIGPKIVALKKILSSEHFYCINYLKRIQFLVSRELGNVDGGETSC